jgi:hypothetical protein
VNVFWLPGLLSSTSSLPLRVTVVSMPRSTSPAASRFFLALPPFFSHHRSNSWKLIWLLPSESMKNIAVARSFFPRLLPMSLSIFAHSSWSRKPLPSASSSAKRERASFPL